jgi:hypothetical protein
MKKTLFSFILIWLLPFWGNSQTLLWERIHDVSNLTNSTLTTDDLVYDLLVQDTSLSFALNWTGKFAFRVSNLNRYNPTIYSLNSNGDIIDTIKIQDTVLGSSIALDRSRKRIWVAYRTENFPYTRTVIEKINFRGFSIVRRDFRGVDRIDSLPATIYKLLPSSDGGFYMLGGRTRVINGQNTEPWQVSRFDSLGNRRWVKEYVYTYAFGNPTGGEFLPNGNLFISGWAGREIYGLEIDTATGSMVNRKVFFTHPENVGWSGVWLSRSPGGYYLAAGDSRNNPETKFLFCRFQETSDSLRMVWGGLSNNSYIYPNSLADSTVWVAKRTEGGFFEYIRVRPDSSIQIRINLSSNPQIGSNYTDLSSIGHFTNQSAIFGGNIRTPTTQGTALYFCKIDSIGTPYNPVYPPVGPVLTSNQRQNQEPNLQVYPNPFTNTLRLSHKGTAQLLDVHGRVILSQPVEAGEELKVANLPKGMYLLRLQSVGGKLYVRKVVRE